MALFDVHRWWMSRTPVIIQAISNAAHCWTARRGHARGVGAAARLVKGARSAQCESPVVHGTGLYGKEEENFVERVNLLNRPLRTRMVGGVGTGS
jgi:hypothetical protein